MHSLGYSVYTIMSSVGKGNFNSSFLIPRLFVVLAFFNVIKCWKMRVEFLALAPNTSFQSFHTKYVAKFIFFIFREDNFNHAGCWILLKVFLHLSRWSYNLSPFLCYELHLFCHELHWHLNVKPTLHS